MKLLKRVTSVLVAVVMVLGITQAAVPVTAEAASKKSAGVLEYPNKVRIYADGWSNSAISMTLASSDYYLKSVKSNSKSLKTKITYNSSRYDRDYDGTVQTDEAEGTVGLYTKKEGNYKVTVTVGKRSQKSFSKTVTITVYAKNDSPFKSVKVGGKDAYSWGNRYYFSQKKLAFKAQAASGYKITKIEVGTYKKVKTDDDNYNTELTWKTLKNGGKFKLGSQKDSYQSGSSYKYGNYESFRKYLTSSLAAETRVRVTYTDKYTRQPATETFTFYYIKM